MGQWEACCLSSSTVRKYLYRNRQDSRLPSRSFIWRKSWERHGPLSRVNGAHSASLYMSRRRFLWMRSFLRLYDFPQVIVADYVEQDSAELDPQLVLLGCGVRFRCSLFFSCRLPASYMPTPKSRSPWKPSHPFPPAFRTVRPQSGQDLSCPARCRLTMSRICRRRWNLPCRFCSVCP